LVRKRIKRLTTVILKTQFSRYSVWFALILIAIVLSIVTTRFFTISNLANVSRQVSVNIILACGMTIVILTGGIDLSVGSVLAFSSVIMADVMLRYGMVTGLIVGVLVGAGAGLMNGLIIARRKDMAFVVTLGTMTIWRSLTAIYTSGIPVAGFHDAFLQIGGGYFLSIPIPFWIAVFIAILFKFILEWTKYGQFVYAIGSNYTAARNCGVKTDMIIIVSYMICGALAAIAGIVLTSRLNAAQTQVGLGYEMDVIAAAVIGGVSLKGGRGRVLGTLGGAILMGVIRNGLNLMNVPVNLQQTIMGLVIVLAIIWDNDRRKLKKKERINKK